MLTVRHPRLPLGIICLPALSVGVYLLAWAASVVVQVMPEEWLARGHRLPIRRDRAASFIRQAARAILCSGSYVLADVRLPSERVAIRIALI